MGLRHLLLPFLCLTATASLAQTYTAGKIQFSQRGTFTQQQLEDASGIHPGLKFTADDLGNAAKRLADTGYFDDVAASLDGPMAAITVKFETKPTDPTHMLHVGFENFVWLTHDEIEAAIKAKFPLFCDYLPENSPHQDEIKAALTEALAAKSITAKVSYDDFQPTLRNPVREVGFRVDRPAVRVANIHLGGVTAALAPLVQKSVNSTARTLYTEGPAEVTTAGSILAPLLDAGYIQAKLTEVSAVPSPADTNGVGVVVSAKLQTGEIYHVSGIAFAGAPLLSAEAFAATAKLHAGDVASRKALLETLAPLDAAYRSKGYMDVTVDAVPTYDAATSQVAYTVKVEPGEPYKVHDVTTQNIEGAAKADFERGYKMKAGEIYNPEYLTGFLKNNTALQALAGYSASYKAYADPNTHTVDLVITFFKIG